MKVREGTTADLPDIVRLGKGFYEQTKHAALAEYDAAATEELLKTLISEPHGAVFVATLDEGEVVGICGGIVYPLWMSPSHKTGQELFWYVLPDHRKSRAGKLMFDALESWAKSAGANSFSMIALSHLHENRVGQMYEKKGYSPLERLYMKVL